MPKRRAAQRGKTKPLTDREFREQIGAQTNPAKKVDQDYMLDREQVISFLSTASRFINEREKGYRSIVIPVINQLYGLSERAQREQGEELTKQLAYALMSGIHSGMTQIFRATKDTSKRNFQAYAGNNENLPYFGMDIGYMNGLVNIANGVLQEQTATLKNLGLGEAMDDVQIYSERDMEIWQDFVKQIGLATSITRRLNSADGTLYNANGQLSTKFQGHVERGYKLGTDFTAKTVEIINSGSIDDMF